MTGEGDAGAGSPYRAAASVEPPLLEVEAIDVFYDDVQVLSFVNHCPPLMTAP